MAQDDTFLANRRTFLRRTAVTGAVGAAATGTAVGRPTTGVETIRAGRAESLLDQHADGVLAELEGIGVLADRGDLPTHRDNDLAGVADGREGAALVSPLDGSAELRVTRRTADGTLTVAVRPADDHAYALLDTGDGRVTYTVDDGWTDFDASTQACTCTGDPCGPYPSVGYYAECCTGSSCDYECKCY